MRCGSGKPQEEKHVLVSPVAPRGVTGALGVLPEESGLLPRSAHAMGIRYSARMGGAWRTLPPLRQDF